MQIALTKKLADARCYLVSRDGSPTILKTNGNFAH